MDMPDPLIRDPDGAVPPFDRSDTGMFGDRTPDVFQGLHDLALDGAIALGPDALRIA